jgi:hypothetical protein
MGTLLQFAVVENFFLGILSELTDEVSGKEQPGMLTVLGESCCTEYAMVGYAVRRARRNREEYG